MGPYIVPDKGPDIEPYIEPDIGPDIEPYIEPDKDPDIEPNIELNTGPYIKPITLKKSLCIKLKLEELRVHKVLQVINFVYHILKVYQNKCKTKIGIFLLISVSLNSSEENFNCKLLKFWKYWKSYDSNKLRRLNQTIQCSPVNMWNQVMILKYYFLK